MIHKALLERSPNYPMSNPKQNNLIFKTICIQNPDLFLWLSEGLYGNLRSFQDITTGPSPWKLEEDWLCSCVRNIMLPLLYVKIYMSFDGKLIWPTSLLSTKLRLIQSNVTHAWGGRSITCGKHSVLYSSTGSVKTSFRTEIVLQTVQHHVCIHSIFICYNCTHVESSFQWESQMAHITIVQDSSVESFRLAHICSVSVSALVKAG